MVNNLQIDPKPDQESELDKMLSRAVEFHGHACPGLAVGVVASKIALASARRAEDEEIVAIVENDACGVDAIQVLTGCTYGKGNLIHKDYGKSVYTFYNRKTGKALRLSVKPEIFSSAEEPGDRSKELFEKIRNGSATEADIAVHNKLREERIKWILRAGEELFNIKELKMASPEKARIFNDVICENCGEPMMSTRICEKDSKTLCIPCCKELAMGNEE